MWTAKQANGSSKTLTRICKGHVWKPEIRLTWNKPFVSVAWVGQYPMLFQNPSYRLMNASLKSALHCVLHHPCLPVPRTEQVPSKCYFKWAKFWASVFPLSFDILLLVQIRQGPVWLWPSLRGLCFGSGYSDQALLLECLITNRNVVLTVVEAQVHSQGTGRCWAWWNLTPIPESYLCTMSGMIHPFLMSSSLKI